MNNLNDLYYFAEVAERGSFTAAAQALNVPKSRLSRHISELETRLGVRLLQRTTRSMRLTAAGERYFQYCRDIAASARAADEAMLELRAEPAGQVVLSCPHGMLQQALNPVLIDFLISHPKVSLHVVVANRPIDLVDEGVDVALRVRSTLDADSGLVVRRIGMSRTRLVASPRHLSAYGVPATPQDLPQRPTLSFHEAGPEQPWELEHSDGRVVRIRHKPILRTSDFSLLLEATVAGRGVALLPAATARAGLQSGALVEVLPGWGAPQGIVHCVYPSRRGMIPAIRALIDYLALRMPDVYGVNGEPSPARHGADTQQQ